MVEKSKIKINKWTLCKKDIHTIVSKNVFVNKTPATK
jgi:hypothetical protein